MLLFFGGKSIPNAAHQGCDSQEETVVLLDESSRYICLGSAWLSVKFNFASVKIPVSLSHHPAVNPSGFTVPNPCNRVCENEAPR